MPPPLGNHVLSFAELEQDPWASCGPACLAALLGWPIRALHVGFPEQTEKRPYTTLRHMQAALDKLGFRGLWKLTPPSNKGERTGPHGRPSHGVALLQFTGSWSSMPTCHPAQLQRTHWIAMRGAPGACEVWDVNALEWQPKRAWEKRVVPVLVEHYGKSATGDWYVRAGIEVPRWGSSRMYYIQDTRQYVGNCVYWWGKNRSGYTTHLDQAGEYTEEEAREIARARDTEKAIPCDVVREAASLQVDAQRLARIWPEPEPEQEVR